DRRAPLIRDRGSGVGDQGSRKNTEDLVMKLQSAAIAAIGVCSILAPALQSQAVQTPPAGQAATPPTTPGAPAEGRGRGGGRGNPPGASTYAQFCASCHGPTLRGGVAGSLVDDVWKFGGDDASITASIHDGRPGTAMVGFKDLINDEQIRQLI